MTNCLPHRGRQLPPTVNPGNLSDTDDDTPITQQTMVAGDVGQQWYFIPYNANDASTAHYESSATYTSDGNYLATSTDTLGHVTTYVTDTRGNTTSVTAANGVKTTYGYDTHGIHNTSVAVSKDDTTAGTVSYAYSQDRLTSITTPGGMQYTLTYDTYGRSAATYVGTAADGRVLSQSTYNEAGLLSKLDYGNGISVNYAYDTLGRQTKMWYSDLPSSYLATFYNARGQVGIVKDFLENARTRYDYDLAGRLERIYKTGTAYSDIASPSADILYTYEDGTNRLTDISVSTRLHGVAMHYDYGRTDFGQMPDMVYDVCRGAVVDVSYTYDALGRLSRRRLPWISRNTDYTYVAAANSSTQTSTQIASVTTEDGTTSYTYDAVGNITSEAFGGKTVRYTYDTLNQLTGVTGGGTTYAYTYDANGNILIAKAGATTNTYTYGDSTWKDLLTAYNGQTITYDAIGNPLTYRDGINLTWKNGRKLATYTKGDTTVTFDYNGDGGRRMKMVNDTGTFYVYVDGVLYAQENGEDVLAFVYDEKGKPYMMTRMSYADVNADSNGQTDISALFETTASGTHYYFEYNLQGDVVGLFDFEGNRVAAYTYDPWGKPLTVTDGNGNTVTSSTHIANLNPLRYRGYYYDTETGFYYLQTRYYDPTTGRFLNADGYVSTGQGMTGYNMFAYCGNNPINRLDETGDFWIGVAIVAALTVVVAAAVKTVVNTVIDTQKNVTTPEKTAAKKDPISAMNGVESKNIANQYQQKLYPKTYTRDNNQANAFKHAMWNAVMTDKIGEEKAKIFADAHEKVYLQVTPTSCEMDLHNNALGRKIAIDYAGQGYDVFAAKIQEAIEGGEAYVITWDEGN